MLCLQAALGQELHRKREAQEALGVPVLLNLAVEEEQDMNWFLPLHREIPVVVGCKVELKVSVLFSFFSVQ